MKTDPIQDFEVVQIRLGKVGLEHVGLVAAHGGLTDLEHGRDVARSAHRRPRGHRAQQSPGGVAGRVNLGRPRHAQFPALRATALNNRHLDPHRRPIAKRQIIDGDLSLADLLEGYLAMGAMRLGAPITTHRDLHSDRLDENLLHDTSGELEQGFEVEGLHTPSPRLFPDVSPLLHVSKSGGGPKKTCPFGNVG